jgi:hypothetical protein
MQARRQSLDAGDHVVDRGKLLGRVTAAFVAADEDHGECRFRCLRVRDLNLRRHRRHEGIFLIHTVDVSGKHLAL